MSIVNVFLCEQINKKEKKNYLDWIAFDHYELHKSILYLGLLSIK